MLVRSNRGLKGLQMETRNVANRQEATDQANVRGLSNKASK